MSASNSLILIKGNQMSASKIIPIGEKADSTRAREATGAQPGTQGARAHETASVAVKHPYRIRVASSIADGRHLRAARVAAGLSRKELARLTRYSVPAVKVWERQVNRAPSSVAVTIERIVHALRIHGVEVSSDPPTITIIRNR